MDATSSVNTGIEASSGCKLSDDIGLSYFASFHRLRSQRIAASGQPFSNWFCRL